MTFKSKKIEKAGEGDPRSPATFTLHGTTKEVVLDVEGNLTSVKDPMGKTRIGGMATTKINRKDFGLAWSRPLETGGVVVGDEVTITIDTESDTNNLRQPFLFQHRLGRCKKPRTKPSIK